MSDEHETHTPQGETTESLPVDTALPEPEFVHTADEERVPVLEEPDRSSVPAGAQLLVAIGLLAIIFGASYVPWVEEKVSNETPSSAEQSIRAREQEAPASASVIEVEAEPALEATSAYIWDIKEQRALYNKNASEQLPLASLTKLMTSLVALESLGDDANVAMTLDAITQDGPSDFIDGELLNAKALSDFALVTSSNDGAYALAAAAGAALGDMSSSAPQTFVEAMNVRAEELGLSSTYFNNPTGLDDSPTTTGGYGSARDVAFLVEYLLKNRPEIVIPSVERQASVAGSTLHTASNTNDIIDRIPGILATKTGYTDLAGGNLVVAFNAGLDRPIVITVLGSSREGRFSDMLKLVRYAQSQLASGNRTE